MHKSQATLVFASLLVLSDVALAQASTAQLPDPLSAGWKGQATCEKLHEDDTLRIVRCAFPPGIGHERHFHPSHYTYVLSGGKVRVTNAAGTQDVDIRAGTGRMSPPIEWHEVLNIGDQTVAFLIVEPKTK